jgi:hypothetical protein
MASERSPPLRAFVHTLIVPRVRYVPWHFRAVQIDEANEAKFQEEGYYPDGPYASQIIQTIRWLNDPICRQSWQNLLIHQGLLNDEITLIQTTTCRIPPLVTIIGVGEIRWWNFDFSYARQLRLSDYMTSFREAQHLLTRFPSLTHLGMVVYMDPPITRRVVDILLQLQTLERLAVVILPSPSVQSRTARAMGKAIYRELFEVDDERLVVLEEDVHLLKMLRQPDGVPFWRMVDRVANRVKEHGKTRPSNLL